MYALPFADFLWQPAGFDIGETGLVLFDSAQPLWRAMLVGLGNTCGCLYPLCFCGYSIRGGGGAGASVIVASLAACGLVYTDAIRNVPLSKLLLWYFLLVEWLPDSTAAWRVLPGVWLSKGGLAFPWWDGAAGQWSWPVQEAFNVSGGAAVTPEYLAVALALSLYTSAFLAEVIRGRLESVQTSLAEAAQTLGATRWQTIRLVVVPQALHHHSCYDESVSESDHSSLAVAVGYRIWSRCPTRPPIKLGERWNACW